ncbi:MAG: hypothetical protein JW864_13670 [Spirochaetes bacterium]|nr:hypothetical protein [Spirochaetota bacterium]
MKKVLFPVFIIIICFAFISDTFAKYEYAKSTGKGCTFCHLDNNGGPLNDTGYAYINNSYNYPIPQKILEQTKEQQSSFHKFFKLILGYIHIVAGFILIGAIFYIHIIVRPASLKGGLPKSERILGLTTLSILTLTGIYLTQARINSFSQFFDNTFGFILFIKIILFLIMLCQALIVVFIIHKKMKNTSKNSIKITDTSEITKDNLSSFNGSAGNPALIVYEDQVYDVTDNSKWKDGRHFGKHSAGADLTEEIKGAPHGAEVLSRIKKIGTIKEGTGTGTDNHARKIFIKMAYINLVIIFLIILCVALWHWGPEMSPGNNSPGAIKTGTTCVDCHKDLNPGIYADWKNSVHSKVNVDCYKCHRVIDGNETLASKSHLKYSDILIAAVVSPRTCSGCHPEEYKEYSVSKHANTLEIINKIDKWLQYGMNNSIEKTTGCYSCHGTDVKLVDGEPVPGTWPNVGVGRRNPDKSLGSCTSCHTRHKFSLAEARKPEACDQCHLGPDHPQIEIYNESKHGTIYHAEGHEWKWQTDDNEWNAGRDFRAPTCSVCHMSAAKGVKKTHNVTERLSWELQAPFTIRPSEFTAFPAGTDWKEERSKMKAICLQCHSETWTEEHFTNMDNAVENYNTVYYTPVKKELDSLYRSGLLTGNLYFDEPLEWEFYELWHHEGRRARMGSAMMAPDYAWWHGFYEVKHRYIEFFKEAKALKAKGVREKYGVFPGKSDF